MWQYRHIKCLDIGCTQFSMWSAMVTCSYTVSDVITAELWEETKLETTGCIWKRKPLPNHAPKHKCQPKVTDSSTMLYRELPTTVTIPTALLRVWTLVLCYVIRGYALISNIIIDVCYSLFLYLSYIKYNCFILLLFIICDYIFFSFFKIGCCICIWNTLYWKMSLTAVSVQLCEMRVVVVAVHLHLYCHSVRNMSVKTVFNSSTC